MEEIPYYIKYSSDHKYSSPRSLTSSKSAKSKYKRLEQFLTKKPKSLTFKKRFIYQNKNSQDNILHRFGEVGE